MAHRKGHGHRQLRAGTVQGRREGAHVQLRACWRATQPHGAAGASMWYGPLPHGPCCLRAYRHCQSLLIRSAGTARWGSFKGSGWTLWFKRFGRLRLPGEPLRLNGMPSRTPADSCDRCTPSSSEAAGSSNSCKRRGDAGHMHARPTPGGRCLPVVAPGMERRRAPARASALGLGRAW